MEQSKLVRDLILTESTWVEEDSYLAQVDMRQRCANIASLEIQKMEKSISDLTDAITNAQEVASEQSRLRALAEGKLAEATMLLEQAHDRINTLEAGHKALVHDQVDIAKALNDFGIEHSGFKKQAPRVAMLGERAREHARQRIEEIKKRKAAEARITELERQLAATLTTIEAAANDGRLYAEGCTP